MDAAHNCHTDSIPSLVAAGSKEVTRRLAVTVPAIAPPFASPPHDDRHRLFFPPPVSAATLVNGAIEAAHSQITGFPQLLLNSCRVSSETSRTDFFGKFAD